MRTSNSWTFSRGPVISNFKFSICNFQFAIHDVTSPMHRLKPMPPQILVPSGMTPFLGIITMPSRIR